MRMGMALGVGPGGGIPSSITITGAPSISGTTGIGDTLTGSDGTAAGTGTTSVTARQWLRDGVAISGATAGTYTLVEADAGTTITFRVTWTDDNGTRNAISAGTSIPAVPGDSMLLENGDYLLLESGDKLLLEA